jgi:hypothetical protein
MIDTTEDKPRRGRPPKTQPDATGIEDRPHHPPITQDGFRDDALKQWLITYFPDLANLAITGRITNHTQP